ncbi:MAG: enoyl-CoA hydratase [Alphaproteobacteria bacterium]|jgi:enoyl-CoA hydratase|nr:enoyl-CoA hydratase [Alphaproteobacteria bacterium]
MIEVTRRGGIAVLTMMHGKANALDIEFCAAIAAQFEALRGSDANAVVLTGQGTMFSAGVDLIRLGQDGADYVRRFLPALHRLYDTVFFFPKPVVAAVNGHAIAGGCVLECCADRRIAVRSGGRIGVTELLVGVPFPALAFEIMRFASPPRYLADGMFSGATFAPEVALARGLVDELADSAGLLDRAVAAAETLGALSPAAFAQTKQQVRQPVADALERHGQRVDANAMDIWTAPETLDRIRDYVSKTFKKS